MDGEPRGPRALFVVDNLPEATVVQKFCSQKSVCG